MENKERQQDVAQMRQQLEQRRLKRGYSLENQVKAIKNKSGGGRLAAALTFSVLLVAVVVVFIALLSLANTGHPVEWGSFFQLEIPWLNYRQ